MKKKHLLLLSTALSFALITGCDKTKKSTDTVQTADSTSQQTITEAKLPEATAFESEIDGKQTSLFVLKNKNNYQAAITNYGARMVGFLAPDKNGKLVDLVIGFGSVAEFKASAEPFFGAIVGRYGNRIAKGKFTLDGKNYTLDINNGVNTLHGGKTGFHNRVWEGTQIDSQTVQLKYISVDGEEGYPGTLTTIVTYNLNDNNELKMSYEISTDKKTVVNVTNHNFWNLNGEGSGTINDHLMMVKAGKYTPVDSTLIPTGIEAVAGTPFDFTKPTTIGARVNDENNQLKYGKGYDHNFVLDKGITSTPEHIATVIGDKSGIEMKILTTEPGLQFYGGNFMKSKNTMKSGAKDDFRTAFCLETQHFPDSPNHPKFFTTVLEAGKTYKSVTIHQFTVK
ncbi:MAG: galactose mutarotase [Pseudarcicella sp.]|nr:galactose mutarotase [Pseudarcicella sp.]